MPNIAIFDVDDTLRVGVSDWKYGGRLAQLLFPDDTELQSAFNQIVTTPEGRGLNRCEWITKAFSNVGRTAVVSQINQLVEQFGHLVESIMLDETRLVEGVPYLLRSLKLDGFRCYAVSGASHENVINAVQRDQLTPLFEGVFGHGWRDGVGGQGLGKSEAVRYVLTLYSMSDFADTRSFVVGDSESDLDLAKQFHLPFYGIKTEWNNWELEPPEYERLTLLSSVVELRQCL